MSVLSENIEIQYMSWNVPWYFCHCQYLLDKYIGTEVRGWNSLYGSYVGIVISLFLFNDSLVSLSLDKFWRENHHHCFSVTSCVFTLNFGRKMLTSLKFIHCSISKDWILFLLWIYFIYWSWYEKGKSMWSKHGCMATLTSCVNINNDCNAHLSIKIQNSNTKLTILSTLHSNCMQKNFLFYYSKVSMDFLFIILLPKQIWVK